MNTPAKTCVICESPLYGRADKTTCSDACRVRLHRQRQHQDILQEVSKEKSEASVEHDAPLDLPWLTKQPLVSTEQDYRHRWDEQDELKDRQHAAEQKRSNEMALIKKANEHYVKTVEYFLQNEQQHLRMRELRRMIERSMDSYKHYKCHPKLAMNDTAVQKCQGDLREIIIILQETYQEAKDSWFVNTSQYGLTNKWRKQLQERLLNAN